MSESSDSSGGYVLKADTGRVYVTPFGFFSRARDFLEASVLLSQKRGRSTFVGAHLSCSAIEMALKAFLLAKGVSKPEVRKLGHNLQKALRESLTLGIENLVDLTQAERDLVLRINADYAGRKFAYFDIDSAVARPMDPELELLPTVARKLVEGVRQFCFDAAGA